MSSDQHHFVFSGQQQQSSRTSELFRSDLITAMKLPDSHHIEPSNYVEIKEPWRTEWEIGVQVCVNPDSLPTINSRITTDDNNLPTRRKRKTLDIPSTYLPDESATSLSQEEVLSRGHYEIDELDLAWLDVVNEKRKFKSLLGEDGLTKSLLQKAISILEKKCYRNMIEALATEDSLKIEYDHSVVCDICKDPDREESNEIVFCDSCNISVHQACYGIQVIPKGSWICRNCSAQQTDVPCVLCPNRKGAMKKIRPGSGWAHLLCALWIPEVKIGNVEKMEPITNIESIPTSRWNWLCCVCRERKGACIQCSYPTCHIAYHVTCGFKAHLEMKTKLDSTRNGVNHESYCPRHTAIRKTPSKLLSPGLDGPLEMTPLQLVEEEFYKYASPEELSNELSLSIQISSLIYNYWKLKRKSQHNQPLLMGLHLDLSYQRLQTSKRYDIIQTPFTNDEDYHSIIHLRHNMEKARNLLYMVHRRERIKHQLVHVNQQQTELELKKLEEEIKQPLCLKRLGVPHNYELLTSSNGLQRLSSNGNSTDCTSDVRTLRKRVMRSTIEDNTSS